MKAVLNGRALYEAARFLRIAAQDALAQHDIEEAAKVRLTFTEKQVAFNTATKLARIELSVPLVGGDVVGRHVRHFHVQSLWEIVRDMPRGKKVETELGILPEGEFYSLQFANTKHVGTNNDEKKAPLEKWMRGAKWLVTECFICDFQKVWKAASADAMRDYIRSVTLYGGAIVATDGHRLHRSKKALRLNGKATNIPIGIVKALMCNKSARVTVSVDTRASGKKKKIPAKERAWQVYIHTDEFNARLEGESLPEFTRYFGVIPKGKPAGTLHAKRDELYQALKAAVRREKDATLFFPLKKSSALKAANAVMEVYGKNAIRTEELKTASVENVLQWNGPSRELGVRAIYLRDALEQCEGEYVVIKVYPGVDKNGIGVIDPVEIDEGGFQAVVMPMRI